MQGVFLCLFFTQHCIVRYIPIAVYGCKLVILIAVAITVLSASTVHKAFKGCC
jgi:hypothetical protein